MLANGMWGQGLLVDTAALAAVALVGYLFGRRGRTAAKPNADGPLLEEVARAQQIADDLRRLITNVNVETDAHGRSVAAFQAELTTMQNGDANTGWPQLRDSADKLIGPTLKLTTNLTLACDQLRRQQARLSAFSGSRIDPATGLHNRRSLEEQLEAFFSIHATGKRHFAAAMFSVSPAGADEVVQSEQRLQQIARLLQECIRDDDFVARYSQDEFVVLMPQTTLAGALAFSERLLTRAADDLACPVCGGVVEAASDEAAEKLLSRADSALYSARAAGGASLFQHTGAGVRRHVIDLPALTPETSARDPFAAAMD